MGGVRLAGRIVLCRAQARRGRRRDARDHDADRKLRIDQYDYAGNDIRLKDSRVEDTKYSVTDQEWFREAIKADDEHWSILTTHPGGERLAAVLAAPIDVDQKRAGVLAIIIELTRVSNFLSQLTVGKSAGAFILDRDGGVIAAPDPDADELNPLKADHPLLPVAVDAIRQARQRLRSRTRASRFAAR